MALGKFTTISLLFYLFSTTEITLAEVCPDFGGRWQGSCRYDDGKPLEEELWITRSNCDIFQYGSPRGVIPDPYVVRGFSRVGTYAGLTQSDATLTLGWIENNSKLWFDEMKFTRPLTGRALEHGVRERTTAVMGFDGTSDKLKVETTLNGEGEGPNPKTWQRKKSCSYQLVKPV